MRLVISFIGGRRVFSWARARLQVKARPAANPRSRIQKHRTVNTHTHRGYSFGGGPSSGRRKWSRNSRVAELFSQHTHTHRINMHTHTHTHTQAVQRLCRLSLGSWLAEVKRAHTHTHTHTRSVVSTVVKSHCSKEPETFDQHYERTEQASGRPARAAICCHWC